VLLSLTPTHRDIMRVLAKEQLRLQKKDKKQQGE
jgi:hypothetical protein